MFSLRQIPSFSRKALPAMERLRTPWGWWIGGPVEPMQTNMPPQNPSGLQHITTWNIFALTLNNMEVENPSKSLFLKRNVVFPKAMFYFQ